MFSLGDLLKDLLAHGGRMTPSLDIDVDQLSVDALEDVPVLPHEGIWRESSFDLQRGLEVSEAPMESMSQDWMAAFAKD